MSTPQPSPATSWWRSPLALLVALVVFVVVALVALTFRHLDTTTLLGFVAPIIAVLVMLVQQTAGVQATQQQHTAALAQITSQTNGVLDKRIADGVAAALSAVGLTGQTATAPTDSAAPAPAAVQVPAVAASPLPTAPGA